MKAGLRRLHQYVGLTMLALWLVQCASGVLMVFHWEIGDALVAGPAGPLDTTALGQRIAGIAASRPGWHVTSLFATGGLPGRFDIFIENDLGLTDVLRVTGSGAVLEQRPADYDYVRAGPIAAAVTLHQSLFAGDRGRWFIGLSGLLLVTNLCVGLRLAWPARGRWRSALLPPRVANWPARLYGWHRAIGLWLVVPAVVFVGAGVLQAFDDPIEDLLGAAPEPPHVAPLRLPPEPVAVDNAIRVALQRFPGATLSGVRMPTAEMPWYRVRVRQRDDLRRVFGTSAAYVGVVDGQLLKAEDAHDVSWRRRFLDATYAVHTGEFAGPGGRCAALLSGSSLIAAMVLGVLLWTKRRGRSTPRSLQPSGASR
jgi:uncharacterized iron-regulated membrane protein